MDERQEIARVLADVQNVPFVGPRQLKMADAILASSWNVEKDQKIADLEQRVPTVQDSSWWTE